MQATSYLVTAWEALAAQQETTMEELPVSFEDVSIVQAVQAQPGEAVTLSVLLDRSHRFQVCTVTSAYSIPRLSAPYSLSHAKDMEKLHLAVASLQHMSAESIWEASVQAKHSGLGSAADVASVSIQVLQETDIIAEGRIKARAAPAAPKKAEEESKDVSAEAPGDTVPPPAEGAATEAASAPAAEAPAAEPAAPAPEGTALPTHLCDSGTMLRHSSRTGRLSGSARSLSSV